MRPWYSPIVVHARAVTWSLALMLALYAGLTGTASAVETETSRRFNIPAQPLRTSLERFAEQAEVQMLYTLDVVEGLQSHPIEGDYSPDQALTIILQGTGLTSQRTDTNTMAVMKGPEASRQPTSSPAAAAPQKPVKVPEIMVKDVHERDDDTQSYVAEEASTATRDNTAIRDIPQSIQVVTRKVIDEQRVFRVPDALQNISGINNQDSGLSLFDGVMIRGFSANNASYFRNGLLDPFAGSLATDTYNVQRLEVLKGPASVLYGQGDPGGIINVVTRKPLPDAAYSANVTLGNFHFYRSELDATGPLNAAKTVLYRLNVAGQRAGSYMDFANRDLVAIAPTVTWLMSPRTTLTVDADYLKRWTGDPFPLPAEGTVLPNINGEIPRNRSVLLGNYSRNNRTSYRVGYDVTHQFNSNWSLRNAFRHTIFTEDSGNLFVGGDTLLPDQRTLTRFATERHAARAHANSMVTNLIGHVRILEMDHTMLAGLELRQEKYDRFASSDGAAPPLDLFAPNYALTPLPFDSSRFFKGDTKTAGAYFQDQITILPTLKFLGGLRFDYVHQSQDTTQSQAGPEEKSDNHAVSPRLGLVYQPIEPLSLYTSWVRGFLPNGPGSFNPDGQLFKPERSTQYEVGMKTFLLDKRLSATLAWFHLTRENLITPSTNPVLAAQGFSVQTGEQRSQGIELDITAQPMPGWNIIASYAYTDAEVTKDNDPTIVTKRLANVPYNKATIWSTYYVQEGSLKGFGIGGGLFGYSNRNATIFGPNQLNMAGYIRADAALYYNRELPARNWLGAKALNVALNVRNLLDQRYIGTSSYGSTQFFFGESRTVFGTVGLQF